MGGVGKTRLAEQVAAELLPSFPDGVWFVDLASLRDADLTLPAIASVLSIQPQPKTPFQQQIIDFLKTKRLLLVLDNFEQLSHKAGILIEELIQNTQFFGCLVTSRDVSTCPYGKQFLVKPLETPPPGRIVSVDSVKLFLVRAEIGDKSGIAVSLGQLGKLAETEGDSVQAVLFLVVAARLYEEMEATDSTEMVEVQEVLKGIQEKISTEEFERIKQQAETMSDDEVVELGLSWGE